VLVEILTDLGIGNFEIKLNHRRLLDSMMRLCGVPAAKFRAICSAIDKLDKEPWSAVREEMVSQKGLLPEVRSRPAPSPSALLQCA
jgi:histidyl-tRNA synthetase